MYIPCLGPWVCASLESDPASTFLSAPNSGAEKTVCFPNVVVIYVFQVEDLLWTEGESFWEASAIEDPHVFRREAIDARDVAVIDGRGLAYHATSPESLPASCKLGVTYHSYNPSIGRWKQED